MTSNFVTNGLPYDMDEIFGVALFITPLPAVLGLNLKVTVRIFIGKVDGFIIGRKLHMRNNKRLVHI